MNLKRVLITAGVVFVFVGLIFFIIRITEQRQSPDKDSKTEQEQIKNETEENEKRFPKEKEKTAIKFAGFEYVGQYMGEDELLDIENKIQEFISAEDAYDEVTLITCLDAIETENKVEFYCTFDIPDEIILYGDYDKNSGKLLQWTEEIAESDAEQKWAEKKSKQIDTQDWPEEEKLPQEWNYIEENQGQSEDNGSGQEGDVRSETDEKN